MRTTNRCPKCEVTEILHIPGTQDDPGSPPPGAIIALTEEGFWINLAHDTFICAGCGYCELYVADPRAIPVKRLKGARVRKGQRAAYR